MLIVVIVINIVLFLIFRHFHNKKAKLALEESVKNEVTKYMKLSTANFESANSQRNQQKIDAEDGADS